jgi:hypothetical protein
VNGWKEGKKEGMKEGMYFRIGEDFGIECQNS